MISQATAARIWNCYREIAAAEKLLADMAAERKKHPDDPYGESLPDVFGRRRSLQLGVPSGPACHTCLDVSPDLGESCIRAHIAHKQAELVEANEEARIELGTEKN